MYYHTVLHISYNHQKQYSPALKNFGGLDQLEPQNETGFALITAKLRV